MNNMPGDFYRRIRIVLMSVPEGCVASYGQIAMLCGFPKHSRQVGYALKRELAGKDVPAHRIVNAQGVLSGARSFEFDDLQKNLLEAEGVAVEWNGREWKVDIRKYGWKTSVQDALFFAAQFEEKNHPEE